MTLRVGKYEIREYPDVDDDPRGVIWLWEQPKPNAIYTVSCDPSYGRAGWHRSLRVDKDRQIDNCAVEVIRHGTRGAPDVQVAEYAAPIDAEDAAAVVNFLGRMFGGAGEDGQALAIIEVHPGPGLLTQRELINRFGYGNLYVWQHLDQVVMKPTLSYGWYSSRQSRQMLWIKGTRHITEQKVIINSPWLVEEMTDCIRDNFISFSARAAFGCHDDRLVAFLINLWAINEWNNENVPEEAEKPSVTDAPDYQCSDMTSEEMQDAWNERFASLSGNL